MFQVPDEVPPPIPAGVGDASWLARREGFYEQVLTLKASRIAVMLDEFEQKQ